MTTLKSLGLRFEPRNQLIVGASSSVTNTLSATIEADKKIKMNCSWTIDTLHEDFVRIDNGDCNRASDTTATPLNVRKGHVQQVKEFDSRSRYECGSASDPRVRLEGRVYSAPGDIRSRRLNTIRREKANAVL